MRCKGDFDFLMNVSKFGWAWTVRWGPRHLGCEYCLNVVERAPKISIMEEMEQWFQGKRLRIEQLQAEIKVETNKVVLARLKRELERAQDWGD